MKKSAFLAFLLLLQAALLLRAETLSKALSLSEFTTLAVRCAPTVPADTLQAIARVESAFLPHAVSLNYPKRAGERMGVGRATVSLDRQPQSMVEAVSWAQWLLKRNQGVSIGLMQISSDHLAMLGLTLDQAFEPCTNVRAGALLLEAKYRHAAATLGQGQSALLATLSAYNTGSLTEGLFNGYVGRVIGARSAASHKVQWPPPETTSSVASTAQVGTDSSPEAAPTRVIWRMPETLVP